ncbi:uncharacterized protein N7496_002692 [Penicillium cataractarum]|uniref:Complex 1 LYR protein domain-containing protein n=1 Tax=Penicillium cataractarum TaxID=2100454 RepID=A0A9W9SM90_9EURO|nr:uncharacterized protein N7496_002692 [Penicillium cataractarum]KAJ5380264.1 hypothetical protein N7496_002692 [Penicillium cataractarum]
MHKVLVPSRSGVHRFACLALYRALLRQCSPSAAGDAPWRDETKCLVQQRFRRYKRLQSPSQIANALKAGYEAVDLLDRTSKGSQPDSHKLTAILSQAKSFKEQYAAEQRRVAELIRPKPVSPRQARKEETIRFEQETSRKHPDAPSILDRPRLNLNGKRKVPVLVNARGIPFLRIKKPQPRNLSGVIRSKLEKRWNRIVIRDRLHVDLLFAKDEDAWDHLTRAAERPTWSEEVKLALDNVYDKIRETDRQNRELAESMWNIVLEERKLAEKEDEQRQLNQSALQDRTT